MNSNSTPLPGPTCLDDALNWPADFVNGLTSVDSSLGTAFCPELQHSCQKRGVVLTSSFSGAGGAETALAMLFGHFETGSASAPAAGPAILVVYIYIYICSYVYVYNCI